MGTNKTFLTIEKERFIDTNVSILRDIFKDVIIVVSDPLEYMLAEATIVTDISPDKYAFVMACDMPFLNPRFVEYMAEKSRGYDQGVLS